MSSAFARYVVLPTAASFLIATSAFGGETCRPQLLASLRLSEEPDGSPSIPASLNGRPIALGIDTGGSTGVLDAASAKDLDLDVSRSRSWLSLPGGINTSLFAEVDGLQLAALPAFESKFTIIPAGLNGGQKVRKIGADALSRYDIEIDFARGEFNVYSPVRCADGAIQLNGETLAGTPMQSDRGHHIFVSIFLDGKPMTAALDTGAQRTVMSLKTAHDLFGLDDKDTELKAEGPTALNGAAVSTPFHYRFKSLSIANVVVSNPDIQLLPGDLLDSDSPQLLLGLDFLRHFHIYVAYDAEYLYIARPTGP